MMLYSQISDSQTRPSLLSRGGASADHGTDLDELARFILTKLHPGTIRNLSATYGDALATSPDPADRYAAVLSVAGEVLMRLVAKYGADPDLVGATFPVALERALHDELRTDRLVPVPARAYRERRDALAADPDPGHLTGAALAADRALTVRTFSDLGPDDPDDGWEPVAIDLAAAPWAAEDGPAEGDDVGGLPSLRVAVQEALGMLTPLERAVVTVRYLEGGASTDAATAVMLGDLAEGYGLRPGRTYSRQRIAQVRASALGKLRTRLEPYGRRYRAERATAAGTTATAA